MKHHAQRSTTNAAVLCADERYFPYAYSVCTQLARYADGRYTVHLLTEQSRYLDRVPDDVPFVIDTPDIASLLPQDQSIWRSVSIPPFGCARLLAPELLKGYSRILYLDSDIRISGSIAPLFDIDLKSWTIAAYGRPVSTEIQAKRTEWKAKCDLLGWNVDDPYFNSGVILIDTDRWLREDVTEASLRYIRDQKKRTRELDQDCLNSIFRRQWLPLSPLWNWETWRSDPQILALLDPVIYHHIPGKPWKFGEASPLEERLFKTMLAETPYEDVLARRPPYNELERYVEDRFKAALWRATAFLPSSSQEMRQRSPERLRRSTVNELIYGVESLWYEDIRQGIINIDAYRLRGLLS